MQIKRITKPLILAIAIFLNSTYLFAQKNILFEDNFEDNNLDKWQNSTEWTTSNENPISGNYSLKHNLTDVGKTSYIYSTYNQNIDNTKTTVWHLQFNSKFKPSSGNNFAYFLMSSETNLTEKTNGYAVGVRLSGSNNCLSLWRINNGNKTLLIATDLTWNINTTASVEVIRDADGNWKIGYNQSNNFNNLKYSASYKDNSFIFNNHGAYFKFTKTRAGLLRIDNVKCYQESTPPQVSSVNCIDKNTINVNFSKQITKTTAENLDNYKLTNSNGDIISIQSARINSSETMVTLSLSDALTAGTYTLSVKNIECTEGLIMNNQQMDFDYKITAQQYDIVINEIMANPKPSFGLPNAEYIEIFNKSAMDINLDDWKIKIKNSNFTLTNTIIKKDSFLIICKKGTEQLFNKFGNVLAVDKLGQLSNSSGNIKLINDKDVTICATNYSSTWITDDFKKKGGYSLERIDVNNCNEDQSNWKACNAKQGGTPGKANSIATENIDTKPFNITKVIPTDSITVIAFFSKPIMLNSINANNFTITSNNLKVNNIEPTNEYYNQLRISFKTPLKNKTLYTINITDLKDVSNSSLDLNYCDFMLPEKAFANNLIINEVLPEPFKDGVDFIEIYNKSDKAIDLSEIILASRKDNGEIAKAYTISKNGDLILPKQYKVLSKNSEIIKEQYIIKDENAFIDMKQMLSLATEKGNITLLDTAGTVIDELNYTSKMHFKLLNNTKGVSLERINSQLPTNDHNNWHSATENVGWATPGYVNSANQNNNSNTNDEIAISPEVFSPDSDGYNDLLNIEYNFEESGYVANITIINQNGVKVKELTSNELLSKSGTITWDGVTDENTKADIGIYVIYIEVFNTNGDVKKYKKTCVVSAKL